MRTPNPSTFWLPHPPLLGPRCRDIDPTTEARLRLWLSTMGRASVTAITEWVSLDYGAQPHLVVVGMQIEGVDYELVIAKASERISALDVQHALALKSGTEARLAATA